MQDPLHECPHCHKKSIGTFDKLSSMFFGAVTCPLCRGKSALNVLYGLAALTAWIVLTWVFIGLAWLSRSSIVLLGTIPAFIVAVNKYLINAPLRAIVPPPR